MHDFSVTTLTEIWCSDDKAGKDSSLLNPHNIAVHQIIIKGGGKVLSISTIY